MQVLHSYEIKFSLKELVYKLVVCSNDEIMLKFHERESIWILILKNNIFKDSDKLYIFQTDVCRSLFITYQDDVDIHGIPALRFVAPPIALQVNTTANIGFCMEIERFWARARRFCMALSK